MKAKYWENRIKERLTGFFFLSGLIIVFLFLTLFSQFLHSHNILEKEGFDCPLYLFSSQSLMSVSFIFILFLILIELLREIFEKKIVPSYIEIVLPDNKSPPA